MTVTVEIGSVVNDTVAVIVNAVAAEFVAGFVDRKNLPDAPTPFSIILTGAYSGFARADIFCFLKPLIFAFLFVARSAASGNLAFLPILLAGSAALRAALTVVAGIGAAVLSADVVAGIT